jgi:hypothetical protein
MYVFHGFDDEENIHTPYQLFGHCKASKAGRILNKLKMVLHMKPLNLTEILPNKDFLELTKTLGRRDEDLQ